MFPRRHPDAAWDLLCISDSSGRQAIDMFGADPQTVADAEIIVLWGSPVGSAAESSGATIASAYDALNGPDHDVDLAESGYLRGAFHLDPAGGMVVAEALAAEGFDPTAAP